MNTKPALPEPVSIVMIGDSVPVNRYSDTQIRAYADACVAAAQAQDRARIAELEATCQHLADALREEVNGPTFMGEPLLPTRQDGMSSSASERHLRRLLAYRVYMPHAYYDDGEAHGTEHGISIDFMREPVADIDAKLRALNVARYAALSTSPPAPPIDMILHCPACGMQHIDADERAGFVPAGSCTCAGADSLCECCIANKQAWEELWTNPPHRSHLCHGCGNIWRPADVPTNGVAAIKTKGKDDAPVVQPEPLSDAEIHAIVREAAKGSAIRRDGTTSTRIARAIERAIAAKGAKP